MEIGFLYFNSVKFIFLLPKPIFFSVYVNNDFAKFLFFKWIISFFVLVSIGLRWNTQLAKLGFTNENAGVEIAEAHEQWCARWTDYLWLNEINFLKQKQLKFIQLIRREK